MSKVYVLLDDFLIPEKTRKELEKVLSSPAFNTEIEEADTHAMGGLNWFPTDLIIQITGLTVAGFFGAIGGDAYSKLKEIVKNLLDKNSESSPGINNAYLCFELEKIDLYFEFNKITIGSIDSSFRILQDQFNEILIEINRLLDFDPKKLTGEFNSITFIFDEIENKWIITHFNKC